MLFVDRTQKSDSTGTATVVTSVLDRAVLGRNLKTTFTSVTPVVLTLGALHFLNIG